MNTSADFSLDESSSSAIVTAVPNMENFPSSASIASTTSVAAVILSSADANSNVTSVSSKVSNVAASDILVPQTEE